MTDIEEKLRELFGFDDLRFVTMTNETRYVVIDGRTTWWCDTETCDAYVIDYAY